MSRKVLLIAGSVLAIVGMCAVLFAMQAARRTDGKEGSNNSSNTAGRLLVNTKGDAPLTLQIANPERAGIDLYVPEVAILIQNTTNKEVSAYAVCHEIGLDGRLRDGGVELTRANSAKSLFRPGESRSVYVGGTRYSSPVERLVISVDFIEFTDGTTWGADKYSSKEVLAGMRAGEEASTRFLRHLLAIRGADFFAREFERAGPDVNIPSGESPKWREGFQRGMAFIKTRVKQEVKEFSTTEIERALMKPIDALDDLKRTAR